jgi:NOL1/NOP2/fmu family ribosome biogenesis protein
VRQKRILMDVWPSLRENGLLIYSTCTFNPKENEHNIRWLLDKNEAEIVRLDISGFEGITEIDYEGIYGYGFHPGKIRGEGLFVAAIRKKSAINERTDRSGKGNDQKISSDEKKCVAEWTDFPNERIVKWGDDIIALACSYEDIHFLSGVLKIVSTGTTIFTTKKKNFLPSHEVAFSIRLKKNQFPSVDLDLSDALSYLRRDNFNIKITERGWNLVTYKGVNLGFVNNIGTRFNNYYPVEWRIRMRITGDTPENIIKWITKKK